MSTLHHKVFSKDGRAATITRLAARKWVVVRGYSGEVQLSHDKRTCPTQRMAIRFVTDWLGVTHE